MTKEEINNLSIEACKLIHVQGLGGTFKYKNKPGYSEGLVKWNEAAVLYRIFEETNND